MQPAKIQIVGEGWRVAHTPGHPAGTIFSGGYDSQLNIVFAADEAGHPGGVRVAGGDPTKPTISGLRIIQLASGSVYWADDSMSLPRQLEAEEIAAIQYGLEAYFVGNSVTKVATLSDISESSEGNDKP